MFYADEPGESYLEGNYRFSRADLERNTILVPDIREIRQGDLVVNYEVQGEPHIGIVVALLSEQRPAYGEDARTFWDQVVLASVRRGFRMLSLGTWGNPPGVFGGFSAEPEAYQIRRLVKLIAGGDLNKRHGKDAWELIERVKTRAYRDYPSRYEAPRAYAYFTLDDAPGAPTEEQQVRQGIGNFIWDKDPNQVPCRFYRELPPSSYERWRAERAIFDLDPEQVPLRVTSYTGWRKGMTEGGEVVSYHRGLDLNNAVASDAILAPEEGIFWFVNLGKYPGTIELPDGVQGGVGISLNEAADYRDGIYGFISVLMTNPELTNDSEERGRVYLFCHQGDRNSSLPEAWQALEAAFKLNYPDTIFPYVAIKGKPQHYVAVKPGDWIGKKSSRGTEAVHVHLEVYEYFPEVEGSHEGHWERVDP